MQEQSLEKSDETIGMKSIVKANGNYARISVGKLGEKFNVNDEVYVLTPAEHSQYLQLRKDAENHITKINQLEFEINDADIRTLKKDNEDLKRQIKNKDNSINTYKTNSVKSKATIDNLQETIHQHEQTIVDLKEQFATLSDKLKDAENDATYWQNSYNNMIDSSDALANKNESLIAENEKLRNDNNAINETNKLLNKNLIASNSTFNQTKQELQLNFQNNENELKETIKNMQSHIDKLTEKYQSLLNKEDYIAPASHYDEILALTNQLNDAKTEINKLNGEFETKLATQKSELDSEYNKEKAQLLVAYNKELDSLKLQYNNLANEYNTLYYGVHSITKLNALFDSRHEKIIEDKAPIELMVIQSEQLPPADEDVFEYVPKE